MKKKGFTKVPNALLLDERISNDAKMLFCYIHRVACPEGTRSRPPAPCKRIELLLEGGEAVASSCSELCLLCSLLHA